MSDTNYCCDRMRLAVEGDDIPIRYTPKFREFDVQVLDGGTSGIELLFCPWCGFRLPHSLRDEWFEELGKRGLDPATDDVPEDFRGEGWYTKR
jgi:hypothetical protein